MENTTTSESELLHVMLYLPLRSAVVPVSVSPSILTRAISTGCLSSSVIVPLTVTFCAAPTVAISSKNASATAFFHLCISFFVVILNLFPY